MSERERYQPGVPCWVDTMQPDPEAALDFYADLFGWEFKGPGPMPGDPPGRYFVAELRGRDVAGIASQPAEGAPPTPVWTTYIAAQSADRTAEAVRRAGGTVLVPPFDVPPAGRMAVLSDPAGAVFCAWEADDRAGAGRVNEPAAWAMSSLNTHDRDGSSEFYGSVFGWETETLGSDAGAMSLWRLPGYVGGEPEQPVPRDVVGVLAPIVGERRPDETQPQWSVDFWVKDADAAAGRAAELGGSVIIAPHDAPGFKRAVLADPQGAVFSVSALSAGA